MNNNIKPLCPFKKAIKRAIKKNERGNTAIQFHEYFTPCDAERCMAYDNGSCKKLEINSKGGRQA